MSRFLINHAKEIQSRIEAGLKRRFSEIIRKSDLFAPLCKEEVRTEEVVMAPVVASESTVIPEPLAAPQEPEPKVEEQSPPPELPPAPKKPKAKRKTPKNKSAKSQK